MWKVGDIATLAQFSAGVYIAYSLFPSLRAPYLTRLRQSMIESLADSEKVPQDAQEVHSKEHLEKISRLRESLIFAEARVSILVNYLDEYDGLSNFIFAILALFSVGLLCAVSFAAETVVDPSIYIILTSILSAPIILQLLGEIVVIVYIGLVQTPRVDAIDEELEALLTGETKPHGDSLD